MLIAELVGIAIGWTLLVLGVVSIVAWALRRRSGEQFVWLFGAWCFVYGLRLLLQLAPIRAALGGSPMVWLHAIAVLTWIVNVPGFAFFDALLGPGWHYTVRRAWQLEAIVAVVGIAIELTHRPFTGMAINSPIVLVCLVIVLVNQWIYRDRIPPLFRGRVVAVAAAVFLLFVFNANLGRVVVPGRDVEPVGVLIFISAVGYAVVGSVLRGEAELASVQRELATARQIQESLLPRHPPQTAGLDVAVRYRPMTAVAGDLFDFVALGPSRLGVLVADVAGHGVPAALVASMVKLSFASNADKAEDPAALITAMNQMLCRHVQRTFVTAIYAIVDASRRTVTLANAGHPSPLVGRADGSVTASEERGIVLGFLEQAPYANVELSLGPCDRLLLFTDGVPEAQNARGEFFDADRMHRWFARDGDAASTSDAALADLRQWRGAEGFDDDVTLVVVRCES